MKTSKELKGRLISLLQFRTESDPLDHHTPGYELGDESAPFFSEAFLYNLLGKEDARSLLARIRWICRICDIDDLEIDDIQSRISRPSTGISRIMDQAKIVKANNITISRRLTGCQLAVLKYIEHEWKGPTDIGVQVGGKQNSKQACTWAIGILKRLIDRGLAEKKFAPRAVYAITDVGLALLRTLQNVDKLHS